MAVPALTDVEEREVERGVRTRLGSCSARPWRLSSRTTSVTELVQVDVAGKAGMGFHDRRLAARARQDHRPRVGHNGRATGLGEEHELDRVLDDHAGGELDERAVAARGPCSAPRTHAGTAAKRREKIGSRRSSPVVEHRCQVGHPGAAGSSST